MRGPERATLLLSLIISLALGSRSRTCSLGLLLSTHIIRYLCSADKHIAHNNMSYPKSKSNSRVVLVESDVHPSNSAHWQSLPHQPSDRFIDAKENLAECLRQDLAAASADGVSSADKAQLLAKWSCISGYCEALTTHKDEARQFCIFPIPIDAINRMIQDEYVKWIKKMKLSPATTSHREAAKAISNAVWKRAISKPSVRDELHANSLYISLRGSVDKKSLDCFGAALVTIAGLQVAGFTSYLTLSEDHAYESHPTEDGETNPSLGNLNLSTCEIAIPGNQKTQRMKRGKEISEVFTSNVHRQSNLSPRTSWLYMATNPVICKSLPMMLAATFGNINCQIEKKQGKSISSEECYAVKRDLLWVLYDASHLDSFPFALSELGDCEENVTSNKGLEELTLPELSEEILAIEKLFIDSILVSRESYNDAQVYPYCYAGHYHKDAGRETQEEEYRLVEAVRLYSLAAKVASGYIYEVGDSLQLSKTMTKIAELLSEDVLLTAKDDVGDAGKAKLTPRLWTNRNNSIALGTWLLAFFDSLLLWEEKSGGEDTEGKKFVEILNPSHKHGISKLFSHFDQDVRVDILSKVYDGDNGASTKTGDGSESDFLRGAITESKLQYFAVPQSSRLASKGGPLAIALSEKKLAISDLDLAISGPEGGRRRRKKARVH